MGSIAAGLFSTHVPRLMILDPAKRKEYMRNSVTTFYDVLPQIRTERIAPLDFDTFVVIDTHWHSTLEWIVNAHERHAGIYTSDEIPWMINEYAYDYPGDPELAALIADECAASGVWAQASAHRGLPVHYGTLNPMHYYNPGPNKKRVLPISVCDTAEVDANLRAWDERIMGWWRAGNHANVLANADDFRTECAPEGRFAHYLAMAGALGGPAWTTPGIQYGNYEAAIGTGQSNFWFPVA